MDTDKALSQRLCRIDSYFQHLVSLVPPQNYYSQTQDEQETSDIEDDLGLLAKELKKSSQIKTFSKKDGKLTLRPLKKESKRKRQGEKAQPAGKKDEKKLSKKRLMRREDMVEIIKKQKADDSGVETIGSVDLEEGKEPLAKSDNVDKETSGLETFEDGKDQDSVDVTKSHNTWHDPIEEGESMNILKKEHKMKQFKVPKDVKQENVTKIESVEKESRKLNVDGETSNSKKKRQKRELETDLDNSLVADIMQISEVSLEKKVVEYERKEKQDILPLIKEQNGEAKEKALPVVDDSKVSSIKKKKKNKEADSVTEVKIDSDMEEIPLEAETSELKMKKKKKKKEDIKEKSDDEAGEGEMVLDLGDFKMSDLDGMMEVEDKGKEGTGDGTKVATMNPQGSQDFLELREKVRSKLEGLKMQRKAKDGNGKKSKQKDLKAKMKMRRKEKKKEALAAKKKLKKQEDRKDMTQKVEEGKEKEEVEAEKQKEDNKIQFSQLEFDGATITDEKKKSKKTKNMIENQTGKNYKVLLGKVEKKKEKYERLKAVDPEMAVDWLSQEKWRKAVLKAKGAKIKDDPELLKKSLKRTEKRKKKSRRKMAAMQEKVLKDKKARQQKRNRNLQEKQTQRKAKKTKRLQKKGKLLLADRDKI